jgi:hypothetical protein
MLRNHGSLCGAFNNTLLYLTLRAGNKTQILLRNVFIEKESKKVTRYKEEGRCPSGEVNAAV